MNAPRTTFLYFPVILSLDLIMNGDFRPWFRDGMCFSASLSKLNHQIPLSTNKRFTSETTFTRIKPCWHVRLFLFPCDFELDLMMNGTLQLIVPECFFQ
jgi:hypothetical protein